MKMKQTKITECLKTSNMRNFNTRIWLKPYYRKRKWKSWETDTGSMSYAAENTKLHDTWARNCLLEFSMGHLLLGPFQNLGQQYHRNEYGLHKIPRHAKLFLKRNNLSRIEKAEER